MRRYTYSNKCLQQIVTYSTMAHKQLVRQLMRLCGLGDVLQFSLLPNHCY